jgi:Glu-tRNA(Gln) amidotransferase subunit E-like FAD-binding protein
MASLSDMLSETTKSKLIASTIKVGSVYRMKLTPVEGVIPKNIDDTSRNKYFVVVGFDEVGNAIGFVLINTNINPNLTEVVKLLHYPILHKNYPFLENRNRYVDCNKIKRITREKFNSLFSADSQAGQLNEEDLHSIFSTIKESPTVTEKELLKYGIATKE